MDITQVKQMVTEKKILVNEALEKRVLNDEMTHEDINFFKRSLNMLEWAKTKKWD